MSISLAVMSFNLHRDSPADGSNLWEHRKSLCADVVTERAPVIVCTQEGLKSQLDDLAALLPCYEQFGVSRKGPGDLSDEHCAILYDTRRVERIDGGTFWLSESPSVPASTSWGADIPSISTWATFQFKGLQPPGFAFQVGTLASVYVPTLLHLLQSVERNCGNAGKSILLDVKYIVCNSLVQRPNQPPGLATALGPRSDGWSLTNL